MTEREAEEEGRKSLVKELLTRRLGFEPAPKVVDESMEFVGELLAPLLERLKGAEAAEAMFREREQAECERAVAAEAKLSEATQRAEALESAWQEVKALYEHAYPDRPWEAGPPHQRGMLLLQALRQRAERAEAEAANMEAALRGVHGITLSDGTVVNVATLQRERDLANEWVKLQLDELESERKAKLGWAEAAGKTGRLLDEERAARQKVEEAGKTLRSWLTDIRDGADPCLCDAHLTEYCCVMVGAYCAYCLAAAALQEEAALKASE